VMRDVYRIRLLLRMFWRTGFSLVEKSFIIARVAKECSLL
jgi:hypothetical protein